MPLRLLWVLKVLLPTITCILSLVLSKNWATAAAAADPGKVDLVLNVDHVEAPQVDPLELSDFDDLPVSSKEVPESTNSTSSEDLDPGVQNSEEPEGFEPEAEDLTIGEEIRVDSEDGESSGMTGEGDEGSGDGEREGDEGGGDGESVGDEGGGDGESIGDESGGDGESVEDKGGGDGDSENERDESGGDDEREGNDDGEGDESEGDEGDGGDESEGNDDGGDEGGDTPNEENDDVENNENYENGGLVGNAADEATDVSDVIDSDNYNNNVNARNLYNNINHTVTNNTNVVEDNTDDATYNVSDVDDVISNTTDRMVSPQKLPFVHPGLLKHEEAIKKIMAGGHKEPPEIETRKVKYSRKAFHNYKSIKPNKVDDKCQCGEGEKIKSFRIVNGEEAKSNAFPWMVSIMYSSYELHFCGGTVICDQYILSAAHCTDGLEAKSLSVRLADHNLDQNDITSAFTIGVDKVIQHKSYNPDTTDTDIALLKLKKKIVFSKTPNVSPICLTPPDVAYYWESVMVPGWGNTDEDADNTSPILNYVELTVLGMWACRNEYELFTHEVSQYMLCAYRKDHDACQGDSGGPLVYFDKPKDKYFQVGIVSWGIGCARPEFPGVYTKLSKIVGWVYDNTKDCTYCQLSEPSNIKPGKRKDIKKIGNKKKKKKKKKKFKKMNKQRTIKNRQPDRKPGKKGKGGKKGLSKKEKAKIKSKKQKDKKRDKKKINRFMKKYKQLLYSDRKPDRRFQKKGKDRQKGLSKKEKVQLRSRKRKDTKEITDNKKDNSKREQRIFRDRKPDRIFQKGKVGQEESKKDKRKDTKKIADNKKNNFKREQRIFRDRKPDRSS
ncbi:uncharacterized protein LOC143029510 [Oratosquilla oratoria]|uniref:uncharacterized protein LOC143029510 n=1 Tax=Oratosquilla oratoria TaxID=337810 RepID=UPI003F767D9D